MIFSGLAWRLIWVTRHVIYQLVYKAVNWVYIPLLQLKHYTFMIRNSHLRLQIDFVFYDQFQLLFNVIIIFFCFVDKQVTTLEHNYQRCCRRFVARGNDAFRCVFRVCKHQFHWTRWFITPMKVELIDAMSYLHSNQYITTTVSKWRPSEKKDLVKEVGTKISV